MEPDTLSPHPTFFQYFAFDLYYKTPLLNASTYFIFIIATLKVGLLYTLGQLFFFHAFFTCTYSLAQSHILIALI